MTITVLKSQTWPEFEADVAKHAFEMKAWRAHMGRVKESERLGHIGDQKHVAYPRPDAHPLVASAVNENDDADFKIKDDLPTSAEILAGKKNALFAAVASAEQATIALIIPPGKSRLFHMKEIEIRAADAKIRSDLRLGIVNKAATAVGIIKPIDVDAEIECRRSNADTKFLAEQDERSKSIQAIGRAAAQMFSEIEDLTLENIDKWKMPDFSK